MFTTEKYRMSISLEEVVGFQLLHLYRPGLEMREWGVGRRMHGGLGSL